MKKLRYRNMKNGLLFFFVITLIGASLITYLYYEKRSEVLNHMKLNVENDIRSFGVEFEKTIADVSSDIFLLKEIVVYRDSVILDGTDVSFTSPHEKTRIEQAMLNWLNVKTIYDQIRIIDNNGQEILRVNYNGGEPSIVLDEDLQDKSGRYYFDNAIILEDNALYLSKLDLNIENGEIEYVDGRAKQMLRLATPIFDENGNKVGIIIVNYLVEDLFDSVERLRLSAYSNLEILNSNGYFLHTSNESIEYGFMFEDMQDEVFSKYHDLDIFADISSVTKQVIDGDELYTYLAVTSESLSNSVTNSLGEDVRVVSETGDYAIFGEIMYKQTTEYRDNQVLFLTIGISYILLSYIFSRMFDELSHARKEQLSALEYSAKHDLLTKLPNRVKLFEELNYKISRKYPLSILFIDFDGFKAVNDTFGHEIGDLALIEGAKRIVDSVRYDDMVARIGGDEFVVLINNVTDKNTISKIAQKILDSFQASFILDGNECSMGMSIGIAINSESKSTEELINMADEAMYKVKSSGKNAYYVFGEENHK